MTKRQHINAELDAQLGSLKEQILAMGRLVDAQVSEAVRALVERDAEGARRLIDADRAVDQMELAVDEQCIRLLALHQPAASDLRFVASALKMVTDLDMNVEVIILPTMREPDGLAMSSRNVYLSPEERRQAAVLYQSLILAQKLWSQGERDAGRIRGEMTALIQPMPLAKIEYISIAHADTLEELAQAEPPVLISMVVRFGRTRLLDNVIMR